MTAQANRSNREQRPGSRGRVRDAGDSLWIRRCRPTWICWYCALLRWAQGKGWAGLG